MSNASYLQVDPYGFMCLNGHKVTVDTPDGTPWKCGEPTCQYYDGVTTDNTPAPADSRSDDMERRKFVYGGEPFKIIESALRAQGIGKPLTDEFYASVIEMEDYCRRRELESRIKEAKYLLNHGYCIPDMEDQVEDRISKLQAELDKLTEGRGNE